MRVSIFTSFTIFTICRRWRVTAFCGLLVALVATAPAEAELGDCSQPVTNGPTPTASDCLFILRSAVGTASCSPACVCAPKGVLPTSATDALVCLKVATGQAGELNCPCLGATTTSTTIFATTTTMTLPEPAQVFRFEDACLQYTIRAPFHGGVTEIAQRGIVEIEVDFAAIEDSDDDGLEEVPLEITVFDFASEEEGLGSVQLAVGPDSHGVEDRRSVGQLIERRNNFPGIFDLPPNVFAGDADMVLSPWLSLTITPTVVNVLHYDDPLVLAGRVTGMPIESGDSFATADATPIFLQKADDSSWWGARLEGVRLTPLSPTCEKAASIR
jgi:hypothetical protein